MGVFIMRKMVTMALVFMMFLVIVACGNDGNSSGDGNKNDANEKGNKVKLKVISQYGGTDPAADVFSNLLKEFEDDHPNVDIENGSGATSPEFNTRLQTQWSSGDYADLTFFFADEKGDFIRSSGNVMNLDELLDEDPEWAEGFNEAALQQVRDTQNGELLSMPVNGYYEGLIVNKQIFEEFDLELPDTWEKFETAVKTLADSEYIPLSSSLVTNPYLIDHYTFTNGGVDGHSEAFSDAYQDGLYLLKETYEWGAFPEDAMTIDGTQAQDYFKTGQAAMMIDGSWAVGGLPDEIAEVTTVMPFPVVPGGKLQYGDIISGFSSGWYMTKDSYEDENKKEVLLELFKFLTSKESIKLIAEAQGSVPAAIVDLEGLNPAQNEGVTMIQNAGALELAADSFISNAAFMYISERLSEIVTGQLTPEEVLEEAEKLDGK